MTCVEDVLVALGLDTRRARSWVDARRPPSADEARVLAAIGRGPCTVDEVAIVTAFPLVHAAVLLGRLEAAGWAAHSDGWWEALGP